MKKRWQPKSLWPRCPHCGLHANGPVCVSKDKCDKTPLSFEVNPTKDMDKGQEQKTAEEIAETIMGAGQFGGSLEACTQLIKSYAEQFRSLSLPAVESKSEGWISVKERLPEKFIKVLMYGSKGNYGIGCVDASGVFDDYALWEGEHVTHWFLPLPPK